MATYTHNGLVGSPTTAWYNVTIDNDNPVSGNATVFVLLNSDGTFTRIIGAGFTYDGSGQPTAGTVSSIQRTNDAAGTTVYETITGLSHSLVTLATDLDSGNRVAFAFIFNAADTFNGHTGNDFFVGGPSADTFTGGNGTDTVSYDNATASITANLLNNASNTNDAVGDTYSSIENLIGSDFDDALFGNGSNNLIMGGLGNDSLSGGTTNGGISGDDTLDGGAGNDIGNYTSTNITAGITVVMSSTSTVTGNATVGTDTLVNVERIRGTSFADSFTATTSFNGSLGTGVEFEGNGGNDVIVGNGTTRIGFSQALAGVTVNLLAGTAQSTAAGDAAGVGADSFAGTIGPNSVNAVNGVRGSAFADVISAAGARGAFDFIGAGGNDTFIGSTEAINNFDNNEARYDVGTSTPNAIAVVLDTTSTVTDIGGSAFGTDTLINVERVRGTAFNDTFTAMLGSVGLTARPTTLKAWMEMTRSPVMDPPSFITGMRLPP